jgi:hypothetical protein
MTIQEPLSKPRAKLPNGIIAIVLVTIITQIATLLMNQPAAYWLNPRYASDLLPLRFMLTGGPALFAGIAALYLLAIGILLKTLEARLAYPLAGGLYLFHSFILFRSIPCGLLPFEVHRRFECAAQIDGANIVFDFLFLLALFGIRPSKWRRWLTWISIPLAVAWLALLGVGLYRVIFPVASAWKPLAPAHSPGPRTMGIIAYDTRRQRAVLFGGIMDWDDDNAYATGTWEWDGTDWHEIKTEVAPPARYNHSMAYDEARGTVILYGGQNKDGALADLWEWNGTEWRQLCPVCNPAARYKHQMFYDTARGKIVAYGGVNKGTGFGEAWMWDGSAWSNFPFSTSAPGFFNSPLVYDQKNQRVVGFVKDADWGGTWIWEGDQWFRPALNLQPSLRMESAMVYDPYSGDIILFGGGGEGNGNYLMGYWLNDTWIFDGKAWVQLQTPLAPPSRYGSSAFYDEVRHR